LNGDLSEMLFHAKIYKVVVLYLSIIVFVVPEYIFDEVLNFMWVLVHDCDQKITNLIFLELLIFIFIELDELDVHQLSHLEG